MLTEPLSRREIGLIFFSIVVLSVTYGLRITGALDGAELFRESVVQEVSVTEVMGHAPNGTRRHRHHHIARASNLEAINHSELEATMDEALIQWGTDVPESKMRAQSPGAYGRLRYMYIAC